MRRLDLICSGAEFSDDRRYRYALWRAWQLGPRACFILLNPSTADENANDPTVERCERRARAWGYAGLEVLNAFALRSTDPAALLGVDDPVGPMNYDWIRRVAGSAALVVCGWGSNAAQPKLAQHVVALERNTLVGMQLYCLGKNHDGHARHPLYVPYAVTPTPYSPGAPLWERPQQGVH